MLPEAAEASAREAASAHFRCFRRPTGPTASIATSQPAASHVSRRVVRCVRHGWHDLLQGNTFLQLDLKSLF